MSLFFEPFLPDLTQEQNPFFIYEQNQIEKNVANLRHYFFHLFDKEIKLSYSVKSQPNFKVLQTICQLNLGLEIACEAELRYALEFSSNRQNLFLGGVGITARAISLAEKYKIGAVHFDSIDLLRQFSSKLTIPISVRFQLGYSESQKAGLTESDLKLVNPGSLSGIHFYMGRESYTFENFERCLEQFEVFFKSHKNLFKKKPTLFFGPGISTSDSLMKIQPKGVLKKYLEIFDLRIELGRGLVGSSGYYCAPILSHKVTDSGHSVVIIDGGLQHLGSPWVTLKGGPLSIEPLIYRPGNGFLEKVEEKDFLVFGSLCLWHDCLHPRLRLSSEIKRGDFLLVGEQGAYGLTAGVPMFISEKLPLEYFVETEGNSKMKKLINCTHTSFETYCDRAGDLYGKI